MYDHTISFNFSARGQGTKLGFKYVSSISFQSMTLFDDVGESICKLLPLKLGCAYVGNKGVTSEGKFKGTTKERTVRSTKGVTWDIKKGATRVVLVEGVIRKAITKKGATRKGAIEEGNFSRKKEVWDGPRRCYDSRDDKGEIIWVVRKCDPRWIGLDDSDDSPSTSEGNDMTLTTKVLHLTCFYYWKNTSTIQVSI